MIIRKIIRLILKTPATPVILSFHLFLLSAWYIFKVFQWVYEVNEWDKRITQDLIDESKQELKKWFTTV